FFWRDTLRQLAGKQVNVLSNKLNQQNIFTVAALRLVPIAPFTIVNMVAGSIQLRFKIFILGTFLGMVPGILGLIMFSDQLVEAIKRPNINNIIMAISIFIVIIIVGLLFKRFFKKQLS
ncbi:MAG: VTT domain-containing protein, partial [Pseudomonadota bacterium]|nr:VTT domain-containing protein [Pseudomonadota bacterium]